MKTRHSGVFHIKEPLNAGRMEVFDFLRGAGMLLVLLHHAMVPYGHWILVFHMPFLFFISGYMQAYQGTDNPFFPYLKRRFIRLVVPYFLFEGLNLFVWSASLIMQGGWPDLSEAVIAILTCVNTEAYTG